MYSPAAFSEDLIPTLRLTKASQVIRRIAYALLILMIVLVVVVSIAPWQQNVTGQGNVVAFDPEKRQQTLEVPIKGRIVRWGKNIVENAHVKKGEIIAEIQDLDPLLKNRLELQVLAYRNALEAANRQLEADQANLKSLNNIVTSYEAQLSAYRSVKDQVIAAATAYIEVAEQKIQAEKQVLAEEQAEYEQLRLDFERKRGLYEKDIVSGLKFQEAERKFKESAAKVEKAKAYLQAAEKELEGKLQERNAKTQKAQVDIDEALAKLDKAKADIAKGQSFIAKSSAEVNKAESTLLQAETKEFRQRSQLVQAPFDGYVVNIVPNSGTRILKEGDPVCTIVPDTQDRAVQIWLDGNDAPLVSPGRHVRLQFEGWPAVQFVGWPSVAVGTFGGRVVSVDQIDNGQGQFRVMIMPDGNSAEWPDERYLRQGVRANGWVLLDTVPLWYEIWRRLNGFPQATSYDQKKDKPATPKFVKPS
ncbi:HlyD family secretion protein [Calycomorphotria hydatis]|uniref:Putative efflux pump membrane fusion protein n=1 Tax=Calycomorphotria hydatis TaxID=2528027 RepID=A0A517T652_9PLAN|nr:HlyD family efflux transporter periplasmic adaptor subunit [Calycomorphotria hydatis]QDT63857.1 putative efflux pump membrane fusion protein [Calycomorphotria hydatis]